MAQLLSCDGSHGCCDESVKTSSSVRGPLFSILYRFEIVEKVPDIYTSVAKFPDGILRTNDVTLEIR